MVVPELRRASKISVFEESRRIYSFGERILIKWGRNV